MSEVIDIDTAAEALREFSRTITRVIEDSVRRLGPPDDPVDSISWTDHRDGSVSLTVTCRSGLIIEGRGLAKLEAIVDAESRR